MTTAVSVAGLKSIKARFKRALQCYPLVWSIYWRTKQNLLRIYLLRYFLHDVVNTYRSMYWGHENSVYSSLSAELLFQYHKIEKGLVMPGARRLFGIEPVEATIKLCDRWISSGYDRSDPVFVGAIETVSAYAKRLSECSLDPMGRIGPFVQAFLDRVPERDSELSTPRSRVPLGKCRETVGAPDYFSELALARRSVRNFRLDPVAPVVLTKATHAAQLAPSACNRQPGGVIIVSGDLRRKLLLSHQNGNRGFGHLAPHIAIVTSDASCFFDASERHQPYIDGGLFAMNFLLSLRDQGVGTCCLNWCVPPSTDREVHKLFNIPVSKTIVMLIAIGYEAPDSLIPQSPRRSVSEVLQFD